MPNWKPASLPPSKAILLLISNIFDVDLHWLETGEGTPYGNQMIPELVEALKPYPDILKRFSKHLPRMTVEDLQHLTDEISKIVNRE